VYTGRGEIVTAARISDPEAVVDHALYWIGFDSEDEALYVVGVINTNAHAGHVSHAAIDMLYTAAGATAVYATSPFDRCLRDARTALQHVCTQEMHFELAGRLALGRDVLASVWALDYRGEAT
jgi:alkylation response protein AidB-like acyl-CoA dehydrogenase